MIIISPAIYEHEEIIGPATRCDEIDHFAAIFMVLRASQTTADYRRCLPENRSSVASQLGAINCLFIPPAIFIAAMACRTIELRMLGPI